jgi:hypothetical protein
MPLPPAHIQTLVTTIADLFSPLDSELESIVHAKVGVRMSHIVRIDRNFFDQIGDLIFWLDNRGWLRLLVQAIIDARPGRPDAVAVLTPLLESLAFLDQTPALTVQAGLGGLQLTVQQDPAVKAAGTRLKSSLEDLTEDISTLHAYKLLHDCLHYLQMQLRRIGNAVRNLQQSNFQDDLTECITQMNSLEIQGRAAANGLSPAERAFEFSWLNKLNGITALAQQALNGATVSPNLPGIQCLYGLRMLIRAEPSRIDSHLANNASALELDKLDQLFAEVIAISGDPVLIASLEASRISLGQLTLQITSLIQQHRKWQEIDSELWIAEETLPADALAPGDFPALWSGILMKTSMLIMMEPLTPWASSLQKWAKDLEVRSQEDWSTVKIPFNQYRQESIRRFFTIDSNLKIVSQQVAYIGDSLRTLFPHI